MAKNKGSFRRTRHIQLANQFYKRKFRWVDFCIYCGGPKECLDHVFPVSIASGLKLSAQGVKKVLFQGLNVIPCCNSCNLIAGDRHLTKILDKRHYIQKKLKQNYYKKLRTVNWDDDEIQELGKNMKEHVKKMINDRVNIENRILWPKFSKIKKIEG